MCIKNSTKFNIAVVATMISVLLFSCVASAWATGGDGVLESSPATDFTYDIANNVATVTSYIGSGGDVIIPENITVGGYLYPVKAIGSSAFAYCMSLTSIRIPDSVTSMGDSVFAYCSGLTSVELPDSITSIGDSVFYLCPLLTSIELPDSIRSIGSHAFAYCSSLTTISLPDGITNIGDYAFFNCQRLSSIELPGNLRDLGDSVFYGCWDLSSVKIPDSVRSLGSSVFYACTSLSSVEIPESVTSIGDYAFYECMDLNAAYFQGRQPRFFGSEVFGNVAQDFVLFYHVSRSESWSENIDHFNDCSLKAFCALTLDLQDGSLPVSSFAVVDDEGHIAPPVEPVRDGFIFDGWFKEKGCTTAFDFAENVDNDLILYAKWGDGYRQPAPVLTADTTDNFIGKEVIITFSEDVDWETAISDIRIDGNTLEVVKYSVGEGKITFIPGVFPIAKEYIIVVSATGYNNATVTQTINDTPSYSSDFTFKFDKDTATATIVRYLGSGGNVVVPGIVTEDGMTYTVEAIGSEAFAGNTSLISVELPASIKSLGRLAFYYCTSLTSINLGESITSLGEYVFLDCISLTSIELPESVTSLGEGAFYFCTGLNEACFLGNLPQNFGSNVFGNTAPGFILYYHVSRSESWSENTDHLNDYSLKAFCILTLDLQDGSLPVSSFVVVDDEGHIAPPVEPVRDGFIFDGWSKEKGCITAYDFAEKVKNDLILYAKWDDGSRQPAPVLTADTTGNFVGKEVIITFSEDVNWKTAISGIRIDGNTLEIVKYSVGEGKITFTPGVFPIAKEYIIVVCATGYNNAIVTQAINDIPTYSSDFTFIFDEDTATATVTGYFGSGGNVVVPGIVIKGGITYTVEAIDMGVFVRNTSLISVELPASIKSLGVYAFWGCTSLTSIELPDSVTSLGEGAFYFCTGLTTVKLSGNLTNLGNFVFCGCTGLTSIELPDSVTSLGEGAFCSCTGLTTVKLPDNLTSLGNSVFCGCTGLTSIELPESITSLDEGAFYLCTSLNKAYFLGNLPQNFGSTVFNNTAPGFILYYHVSRFDSWSKFEPPYTKKAFCKLTLDLQDGDTPEGSYVAIDGEGHIATPVNPVREGHIFDGWHKDRNCTDAFDFVIDDVTDDLTLYAKWVEGSVLPAPILTADTVNNIIGNDVIITFDGGEWSGAINSIEVDGTALKNNEYEVGVSTITIDQSLFTVAKDYTIIISAEGYSNAMVVQTMRALPGIDFTYIINNDSTATITGYTGSGGHVVVPETITEGEGEYQVKVIDSRAFYGCTNLTSVIIPEGVTNIGSFVFYGCNGLVSVDLPNSITDIREYTFYSCTGLTSIVLPGSVTHLGGYAFQGCTGLKAAYFLGTKPEIFGEGAFFDTPPDFVLYYHVSKSDSWSESELPYTKIAFCKLILDLQDGNTPEGSFVAVDSEGHIATPANPVRENHIFNGWYRDKDCTDVFDFVIDDVTDDLTLYAKWVEGSVLPAPALVADTIDNTLGNSIKITFLDDVAWRAAARSVTVEGNALGSDLYSVSEGKISIEQGVFTFAKNYTIVVSADGYSDATVIQPMDEASPSIDFTYIIVGNTATITGYTGSGGNVVVPGIVTESGVAYPVTIIDDLVFLGCTSLTSIKLPNSVTCLGDGAFYRCTSLTSIRLPDSLSYLGNAVFCECTSLTSIELPDSVKSLGIDAFAVCVSLTHVKLPENLISLGKNAFCRCTGLTSIELPGSVTSLGENAFFGCINLNAAYFWGGKPQSFASDVFVNTAPGFVLYYHVKTSDSWPDFTTSYVKKAFCKLTLDLQDGDTPEGSYVVIDGEGHIAIPVNPVREGHIFDGWHKNRNCTDAFDFVIDDVTDDLTLYAKWVEGSVLPAPILTADTVNNITGYDVIITFDGGEWSGAINSIAVDGTALKNNEYEVGVGTITIDRSLFTVAKDYTIIISAEGYSNAMVVQTMRALPGIDFTYIINDDNTATITGYTGSGGHVVVPGTIEKDGTTYQVKTIGKEAFLGCRSLTSVELPRGLDSLGCLAFCGCTSLTSINFPSSITELSSSVFYGCNSLTSAVLPDSLRKTGSGSFYGCTGLTSVKLPENITELNVSMFYGCTGLTSIEIPKSVTYLYNDVFHGCTALNAAYFLGDLPRNIPASAFSETAPDFVLYYHVSNSGSWSAFTIYETKAFCILTVDLGDASTPMNSFVVVDNGHIAAPVTPFREGYTFGGWFEEADCINLFDFTAGTVSDDLTLYAKWVDDSGLPAPTLTADTTDNIVGNLITITFADDVIWRAAISGISVDGEILGSDKYIVAAGTINIDQSVFSISKTYTIVVSANGYIDATVIQAMDEASPSIDFIYTIVGDTAIITGYTGGGGDVLVPGTITENGKNYPVVAIGDTAFSGCTSLTSIVLPDSITELGNYLFYCCTGLNAAYFLGERPQYFSSEIFSNTAPGFVLYYHVSKSQSWSGYMGLTIKAFCTLTLDRRDGSTPVSSFVTVDNDGHIAAPAAPVRGGYIFIGWFKEAACTNAFDFNGETVNSDLTLFAKWLRETTVGDPPVYIPTPVLDDVYTVGETQHGIKTMTVNTGYSGLKYFTVNINPVVAHDGDETIIFAHLRDGIQLGLIATRADFDLVRTASAGLNVQVGDVIKVYVVDDLNNATDFNPTIYQ